MKKVDKEALLSIYSKFSIFIGLGIFLILVIYNNSIPSEMFGVVDKGIFNIDFTVAYGEHVEVFNYPLVWFIIFFLLNLGILIYSQIDEKVDVGTISASIFYNTILSFLLILSQLVFYYVVPDTINGAIEIGLFQYEFYILSDVVVGGLNFTYFLATIYTFYNVFVVYYVMRNSSIEE